MNCLLDPHDTVTVDIARTVAIDLVVAGAAGLRLGWTVISPGDRSRWKAVAHDGRAVGNVVIGLVLVRLDESLTSRGP